MRELVFSGHWQENIGPLHALGHPVPVRILGSLDEGIPNKGFYCGRTLVDLESKALMSNGEAALCNHGGHWEVLREELGIVEEDVKEEESFEIEEVELVVKLEGPREEPFGCHECDYVGPNKKALGLHRRRMHPVVNYECPACGNGFESQMGLSKHLALKHAEEVDEDGDPYVLQPHVCQCGKRYGSKHALTEHRRKTGHRGGEHECPACELSFDTPHGLSVHLAQKHAEEVDEDGEPYVLQPHVCQCGKRYARKTALTDHRRNTGHGGGEHECPGCELSFDTPMGLTSHLALKHANDVDEDGEPLVLQPHACKLCGKTYRYKKDLNAHRRAAHDLGEFDCSICQQSFETPHGLSLHLTKKHGDDVDDDGEFLVYKPFRCQDCGKGYTFKNALTTHRRKKHTKSQRRPHDSTLEPPIPPMAPKRRRNQ